MDKVFGGAGNWGGVRRTARVRFSRDGCVKILTPPRQNFDGGRQKLDARQNLDVQRQKPDARQRIDTPVKILTHGVKILASRF